MKIRLILRKILKISLWTAISLAVLFLVLVAIFSVGSNKPAENMVWGINFSQKHALALGLNWREAYLAILDDLGARQIRIASHWDLLEKEPGQFDFSDLDWQIDTAATRNAKIILAIGMKTPRWPECHLPGWTENKELGWIQGRTNSYIGAVMERYRSNANIVAWQIENEPFFYFGVCPPLDPEFFQKEIALARQIDPDRKIMVTDSGEFSSWFRAAALGDMVGITLYREAYFHKLKMFLQYPLTPTFYRRKAQLAGWLYGKKVFPVEVQAEPWFQSYPLGMPGQKDQDFTLDKFKNNLEYTRQTGFEEAYLWGAEWWYYQKTKQNDSAFWEEARTLYD